MRIQSAGMRMVARVVDAGGAGLETTMRALLLQMPLFRTPAVTLSPDPIRLTPVATDGKAVA